MHRFRKKSDAKRSQVPDSLHGLPELPPASNFRTSLILPDLTRRFTILRTSSGNPVSLDDLRTRFAEQRARGADNQISEEEEDMILETLGRFRSSNTSTVGKTTNDSPISPLNSTYAEYQSPIDRQSMQSTKTASSSSFAPGSLPSSPTGRFTKRYSNNLFGSGRFRDDTYFRSVGSSKGGSPRNALSVTPSETPSSAEDSAISDSARPTTPDNSALSSSVQSSPENVKIHSAPPAVLADHPVSVAEYRLSKVLGSAVFKRASLALEEAIKEIEEEAEDEIVMPRSAPASRTIIPEQSRPPVDSSEPSPVEAGTAISSDKQVIPEVENLRLSPVPQGRPGTTSPTPRLPGYIPGMPRPMTPRDLASDSDDHSRPHSTTPRATSPLSPNLTDHPSNTITGLVSGLRRDSNASNSRYSPRPNSPNASSPFYLPKIPDGGFLPDDHLRSGESFSSEFDTALNSSVLGRRRPASPLSAAAFQPMAVSSRPGTPSNVTWDPPASPQKLQRGSDSVLGHNRDGSWVSESGYSSDIHNSLGRPKSTTRSLFSPAFPDSPLIDRSHGSISPPGWNHTSDSGGDDNRPPSVTSGIDATSPISTTNRALRSPTPTSNAPRSPTSPTFANYETSNGSPRISRQTAPSPPFSIASYHPLVFSPLANSSRSSLESAGSSYHSWDGHRKETALNLFNDIDTLPTLWHDVGTGDNSSSATPGDSQDESWNAEAVIARYAGLTKADFVAIQDKLVGATLAKGVTPDIRDRVPSLRRRRPSTSQSNYSLNGRETKVVSPLPTILNTNAAISHAADKSSKASALLDSVVDSIQSPLNPVVTIPENEVTAPVSPEISPTTRRNRDLAQILFGEQGRDHKPPSAKPLLPQSVSSPSVAVDPYSAETAGNSSTPESNNSLSEHTDVPMSYRSTNASVLRSPQTPIDQADLTKEVQRKADAAMLALRRTPSQPKSERAGVSGSISRRRISPGQISNPRLVSASTSVDTIPLQSTPLTSGNAQVTSKISQRIRRLRGTLRAKPTTPQGDEVTPYPLDLQTPPSSQTAYYDPASLRVPGEPTVASATEVGRFKVPVPTPPASAGPGLRGFMARFRKQRTVDSHIEPERRRSPNPPASPLVSPQERTFPPPTQAFSPTLTASQTPTSPQYPYSPLMRPEPVTTPIPTATRTNGVDDVALKQFFDAASNLGLDQEALNDLLARSSSPRSTGWSMLTRDNSFSANTIPETVDETVPEIIRTPAPPDGRLGTEAFPENNPVRKLSIRKGGADHLRRPRNVQDDGTAFNAIVRRTIIFPSESKSSTIDLNVLMRKNSQSQSTRHRRSPSVASISSRSVHDRVPTPPPPRSPTKRRFSADNSPPVPQLPPSFSSHGESLLQPQSAPAGPIEKSPSAHDSLYEMYTDDSKPITSMGNDAQGVQPLQGSNAEGTGTESGPALEVIEMANGETIWSIVNGLRDDDSESFYGNRTSFASEYSVREPSGSNGDNVQILVKEHGMKGGSANATFLSRKKSQTKSRPETKVFYSSSAQIGRLIENLSQGMEAGSFNFLPQSHSYATSLHSENDVHWTVEERLDHMIGSMGSN